MNRRNTSERRAARVQQREVCKEGYLQVGGSKPWTGDSLSTVIDGDHPDTNEYNCDTVPYGTDAGGEGGPTYNVNEGVPCHPEVYDEKHAFLQQPDT